MNELDDINAEEKKAIQERSKRKREKKISDLRKVLALVEGRRLLWGLMDDAGVFLETFDENPYVTARREGYRRMGVLLLNEILAHSPATFSQMQREYISDLKNDALNENKKREE